MRNPSAAIVSAVGRRVISALAAAAIFVPSLRIRRRRRSSCEKGTERIVATFNRDDYTATYITDARDDDCAVCAHGDKCAPPTGDGMVKV
jgi:hypothetical protein